MPMLGIVLMRAFGRSGIQTQARIIERFEAGAAGIVSHHRVATKELEEGWTFDLGLTGSCDFTQHAFLLV